MPNFSFQRAEADWIYSCSKNPGVRKQPRLKQQTAHGPKSIPNAISLMSFLSCSYRAVAWDGQTVENQDNQRGTQEFCRESEALEPDWEFYQGISVVDDSILDVQMHVRTRKVKLILALWNWHASYFFIMSCVSLFALTSRKISINFMTNCNPPEVNGREERERSSTGRERHKILTLCHRV